MKNQKIKNLIKKFPTIVFLKKLIWRILGLNKPHSVFVDEKYFEKLFASSRNVKSISFEHGLLIEQFEGTSYLLKIHPKNSIESCVYLDGTWEPHIAKIISGYLNDSKNAVIDVGANIGAVSIPLAKHYPNSHFYLFEPHPFIFSKLINNINYNKLENVTAQKFAITDSTETSIPFYAQKNSDNLGLSSIKLNHDIKEYDLTNVSCGTLDSFFLKKDVTIKIIKIDTQGTELNVLLSGKKIINRDRPIIIFEFESDYFTNSNDEKNAKQDILDFFEKINYELFMIDNNIKFMPKLTLKDYFQGDIIAVPSK
jgi:FkbM family methyltransferase